MLLLGVRPALTESLIPVLSSSVYPIILSASECLSTSFSIPRIDKCTGTIKLPAGPAVNLDRVRGTYSEDLLALDDGFSSPNGDLVQSEYTALLAYIRHICKNCINPPRAGSLTSFCETLFNQWNFVTEQLPTFLTPSSTLETLDHAKLLLSNIYDYRFPAATPSDDPVFAVDPPSGTRAVCVFVDDMQWHVRQEKEGVWKGLACTARFHNVFAKLICSLRQEYHVNVGTIRYFYAGVITFWSVSPIPDFENFPLSIRNEFLHTFAVKLTLGDENRTYERGNAHVPVHQDRSAPLPMALHPLLQGYERRASRAANFSLNADTARTCVKPFVVVLSSAHDPTARHLVHVGNQVGLNVSWISFEWFCNMIPMREDILNKFSAAEGIFVRYAVPSSEAMLVAQSYLRASLSQLSNVIVPSEMSTNWSKPLQLNQLLRQGINVPRTAIAMIAPNDMTIAKGMGSLPTFATDAIRENLTYPLMYQEAQKGSEIRVHIVDGKMFAHKIITTRVDYREDREASIEPYALLASQEEVLGRITKMERQRFSGVDMFECDGETVVLEVNPMPGYHSYEGKDVEISRALLVSCHRGFDSLA